MHFQWVNGIKQSCSSIVRKGSCRKVDLNRRYARVGSQTALPRNSLLTCCQRPRGGLKTITFHLKVPCHSYPPQKCINANQSRKSFLCRIFRLFIWCTGAILPSLEMNYVCRAIRRIKRFYFNILLQRCQSWKGEQVESQIYSKICKMRLAVFP